MSPKQLLIRYTFKYPVLVLSTIILGFSGALFNGVSTILIIPLLIGFIGQDITELLKKAPAVLQKVIAVFDYLPESQRLPAMFAAVFTFIILKNITTYFSTLISGYLSRALSRDMRLEATDLLLKVDIDFYNKNKMGDIFNRFMSELTRVVNTIKAYTSIVRLVITIFVFLALLISLSWQLTLISTVLLSILGLINQYFIKKSKRFGIILSVSAKEQTNKFLEILTGIRLIKAVSNEGYEYKEFEKYIREREKAGLDSQMNSSIIGPINEIGGIILVLLIILAGRYLFASQLQTFSAIFLTYLLVLFRLMPLVSQLNGARSQLSSNRPAVDIVADLLRRDNKQIMVSGDLAYTTLEHGIGFEGVKFSYPGHDELVLKGIDLWIPKGKIIALVGASGAGKSTIAELVPRFYDPTQGRITIDGKDLRDYEIASLRQAMGIVSQDTFLFNNTIRYNIAYGLKNATDDEIIEATKRANAYEFIVKLPKGLDTELGDRGVRLSGGQRQRIAIARALLRNPNILILDEATSALDTVSERLVQQALDELCRERTTLVIAHRLSTIQKAYQIVVLDKGYVVEIGNHEELLSKEGYYARLYKMQFMDKPTLAQEQVPNGNTTFANNRLPAHISYEIRSRLNALLGSLMLVSDGLIDNTEEQKELLEESCNSAMRLLVILKAFETENSQLVTTAESSSENFVPIDK